MKKTKILLFLNDVIDKLEEFHSFKGTNKMLQRQDSLSSGISFEETEEINSKELLLNSFYDNSETDLVNSVRACYYKGRNFIEPDLDDINNDALYSQFSDEKEMNDYFNSLEPDLEKDLKKYEQEDREIILCDAMNISLRPIAIELIKRGMKLYELSLEHKFNVSHY